MAKGWVSRAGYGLSFPAGAAVKRFTTARNFLPPERETSWPVATILAQLRKRYRYNFASVVRASCGVIRTARRLINA
jgi:hypothetical protein